jgi:hypothetical protein
MDVGLEKILCYLFFAYQFLASFVGTLILLRCGSLILAGLLAVRIDTYTAIGIRSSRLSGLLLLYVSKVEFLIQLARAKHYSACGELTYRIV